MTFDMQSYKAPEVLTVELPDEMGTLSLRPMSSTRIDVQSPMLLIGRSLYRFEASMARMKTEGLWYFVNRAEIGEPGGRPSPKRQQEALEIIGGAVNASLARPEFQARFEELRVIEEQKEADVKRRRLYADHHALRNRAQQSIVHLADLRTRVETASRAVETTHQELTAFEEAHPEILETSNFES